MPGSHGGRRVGAGRPTEAAREAKRTAGARAQELVKQKTYQALPEIWEKVLELAKQGDKECIKLAVEHGLGKPTAKAPETDGNEFKLSLNFNRPKAKAEPEAEEGET